MWKSKCYGASVLNRRVVLHAIDATMHPTHGLISTQEAARREQRVEGFVRRVRGPVEVDEGVAFQRAEPVRLWCRVDGVWRGRGATRMPPVAPEPPRMGKNQCA